MTGFPRPRACVAACCRSIAASAEASEIRARIKRLRSWGKFIAWIIVSSPGKGTRANLTRVFMGNRAVPFQKSLLFNLTAGVLLPRCELVDDIAGGNGSGRRKTVWCPDQPGNRHHRRPNHGASSNPSNLPSKLRRNGPSAETSRSSLWKPSIDTLCRSSNGCHSFPR